MSAKKSAPSDLPPQTMLTLWQAAFALGHWDIDLAVHPGDEMQGRDAAVSAQAEYDHAVMALREPTELQPVDMEESIVHELLHVLLEGHKNLATSSASESYDPMYERGLNVLAAVLVSLRRGAVLDVPSSRKGKTRPRG